MATTLENLNERIEAAARGAEPVSALIDLVYQLRREGMTKQSIGEAYYEQFKRLVDEDCSDLAETCSDHIADVLDWLTGWCHPTNRLLPDEPDVKLGG